MANGEVVLNNLKNLSVVLLLSMTTRTKIFEQDFV